MSRRIRQNTELAFDPEIERTLRKIRQERRMAARTEDRGSIEGEFETTPGKELNPWRTRGPTEDRRKPEPK